MATEHRYRELEFELTSGAAPVPFMGAAPAGLVAPVALKPGADAKAAELFSQMPDLRQPGPLSTATEVCVLQHVPMLPGETPAGMWDLALPASPPQFAAEVRGATAVDPAVVRKAARFLVYLHGRKDMIQRNLHAKLRAAGAGRVAEVSAWDARGQAITYLEFEVPLGSDTLYDVYEGLGAGAAVRFYEIDGGRDFDKLKANCYAALERVYKASMWHGCVLWREEQYPRLLPSHTAILENFADTVAAGVLRSGLARMGKLGTKRHHEEMVEVQELRAAVDMLTAERDTLQGRLHVLLRSVTQAARVASGRS